MLTISSVKDYHRLVADLKYSKADKTKSNWNMFYFATNKAIQKGFRQERVKGYVIHNDENNSAEFFLYKKDILKKHLDLDLCL